MAEQARVVAAFGRECLITTGGSEALRAVTRGRCGTPVCNDVVVCRPGTDFYSIEEILPRQAVFWRYERRGGKRPLASHLDQVLIINGPDPVADARLLDRYIAATDISGLRCVLVWNKSDLSGPDHSLMKTYLDIGYPMLEVSAATGAGLADLRATLAGRSSLLVGLSGAGKSSLVNALVPGADTRIAELSTASGEGQHTTTAAAAYSMEDGILIDTPGVREYYLWPMPVGELERGYAEIAARAPDCRFRDCRHREEPGCVVRDAVDAGEIDSGRYRRFCRLSEGLSAQLDARKAGS